jgi:hypothetical protein
MIRPTPEKAAPAKATKADPATPAKAAMAKGTPPEPQDLRPKTSIFDTSYAPEGAELRKAWSRFDRKGR